MAGPRSWPTPMEHLREKWLFLNGSGGAEYVEVKVGLFRVKTVLIPVQTVTVDTERWFLVLE